MRSGAAIGKLFTGRWLDASMGTVRMHLMSHQKMDSQAPECHRNQRPRGPDSDRGLRDHPSRRSKCVLSVVALDLLTCSILLRFLGAGRRRVVEVCWPSPANMCSPAADTVSQIVSRPSSRCFARKAVGEIQALNPSQSQRSEGSSTIAAETRQDKPRSHGWTTSGPKRPSGKLLLSPTRTYGPIVQKIFARASRLVMIGLSKG